MTRIKLEVFVDLDPVPGTFHSAESAQNVVRNILMERIPHYNPTVSSGAPVDNSRAYARGDVVQIRIGDKTQLATLVDIDLLRGRFKVQRASGERRWLSFSEIIRKV